MYNIMINRYIISCLCNRKIPAILCLVPIYTHDYHRKSQYIFFPQLVIISISPIDLGAYRRRVSLLIDRQGRSACCVNRVINPYRGSGLSSYRLSADTLRTSKHRVKENNIKTTLCQTIWNETIEKPMGKIYSYTSIMYII